MGEKGGEPAFLLTGDSRLLERERRTFCWGRRMARRRWVDCHSYRTFVLNIHSVGWGAQMIQNKKGKIVLFLKLKHSSDETFNTDHNKQKRHKRHIQSFEQLASKWRQHTECFSLTTHWKITEKRHFFHKQTSAGLVFSSGLQSTVKCTADKGTLMIKEKDSLKACNCVTVMARVESSNWHQSSQIQRIKNN